MRISDWSSDLCSSDLGAVQHRLQTVSALRHHATSASLYRRIVVYSYSRWISSAAGPCGSNSCTAWPAAWARKKALRLPIVTGQTVAPSRSEEHTSELQSLMRISYAVFCLKKKKTTTT